MKRSHLFEEILKIVFTCVLVVAGIVGGFLAYMTLTKEQPADVMFEGGE